jgi:hypothetical protein
MGAWVEGRFKSYGVGEIADELFRAKNESDVAGETEGAWGRPFLLLLL